MKIILSQQLNTGVASPENKFINIYKTFDSVTIPHKGDFIDDSLWKDPYHYEVAEVIINYANNTCFIEMFAYKLPSNDAVDQMVQLAENSHGWTTKYPM